MGAKPASNASKPMAIPASVILCRGKDDSSNGQCLRLATENGYCPRHNPQNPKIRSDVVEDAKPKPTTSSKSKDPEPTKPICAGIIVESNGQCPHPARANGYCGYHQSQAVCRGRMVGSGKSCSHRARANGYCGYHQNQAGKAGTNKSTKKSERLESDDTKKPNRARRKRDEAKQQHNSDHGRRGRRQGSTQRRRAKSAPRDTQDSTSTSTSTRRRRSRSERKTKRSGSRSPGRKTRSGKEVAADLRGGFKGARLALHELEHGKALPADTYIITNVIGSSIDSGNHISWYETNGGGSTARCAVYGCGGEGQVGGHVRLWRYHQHIYCFLVPICVSHNNGGTGGAQSGAIIEGGFARTKGRIKPVIRRWHSEIPVSKNDFW